MTDLALPAKSIPVPASVSAEARAFLAQAAPLPQEPPAKDIDAWRQYVVEFDANVIDVLRRFAEGFEGDSETSELPNAKLYRVTPSHRPGALKDVAYFEIHGGALVMLGGELCRLWATIRAKLLGVEVISVDYRMPPDHPYPAALDDCMDAYRAVLERYPPEKIVVGGVSAGGNLAAALLLRARDEGLPLPAGTALVSPELDLTESGDTFVTNLGIDLLPRLTNSIALYAAGHDLSHPYVSPLFGDFSKGFPPSFITSGTRDLFLSNAVRMHRALRKAGVDAELHIGEAMPHGGFFGAPEDIELEEELCRFTRRMWKI